MKRMIETALKRAGGVMYLTQQAHANPAAFLGLVGKIIPKDIHLDLHQRSGIILQIVTSGASSALPQAPRELNERPESVKAIAESTENGVMETIRAAVDEDLQPIESDPID